MYVEDTQKYLTEAKNSSLTLNLLNTTIPTFANSVDLIRIYTVCHAVCKLNEYIISSNLIRRSSEMGVAKLIYPAG